MYEGVVMIKKTPKIVMSLLLLTIALLDASTGTTHDTKQIHNDSYSTQQTDRPTPNFISTLTKEEQNYLKSKKVITMSNNPNWTPIVFAKDGDQQKMQGITIDTLKEIEKRIGIKFKNIPNKSWKKGQQFLKDKKIDILPCYIKNPAREKYALFTRPYLRLPLAIFATKDKPIVSGLDEVMDKSWTRQGNSGLIKKIQREYPDTKIIRTSGDRESFQYVNSGKAYFTIATLPVASHVISKYMFNDLQIIGYTDFIYYLHIAVNDDYPILHSILDKALADIPEKRSKEIFRKWVSPSVKEPVTDYKLLGQVLLIFFIVGVFFVYRQYILNKNIAKLKIAEQKLVKSKEEWEKTFNAITDIVTLQDADMNIIKINQAGCDEFGLNLDNKTGHHCYELFLGSNEPCPDCPILVTKKTFSPCSKEVTYENLGRTFLVSSAPVLSEDGTLTHIAHVAKDITAQKKIEKELFQAHKMEAMGTLAGGIAHDFNNILSAIQGYSEIAKSAVPADSDVSKNIDQVIKASKRATDLVQHILTFSRMSDHVLKPIEPQLIIKEALKMLRASLPTTITIEEDIDSKCGKVMADATNIHRIIINLCTNSFHAMEKEKGILRISLYRKEISDKEIAGEPGVLPGPFIVLVVSDTGHGMDQATIERIFDPYFTTKEAGKGTGLGLAVIHGIINEYHGFIRVKSEPGKGTTFYVYIPALEEETSSPAEIETEEPLLTGTERILFIDDETMIVNLNKTILERLGYEVTAITESLEALEKIRTDPDQFDVIITDQTMPHLTGSELAQEVLKIKPNMPIILCTGYSSVLSEKEALAIGIKKYVRKPVDSASLSKIVRKVLDKKQD